MIKTIQDLIRELLNKIEDNKTFDGLGEEVKAICEKHGFDEFFLLFRKKESLHLGPPHLIDRMSSPGKFPALLAIVAEVLSKKDPYECLTMLNALCYLSGDKYKVIEKAGSDSDGK